MTNAPEDLLPHHASRWGWLLLVVALALAVAVYGRIADLAKTFDPDRRQSPPRPGSIPMMGRYRSAS